MSPAIANWTDEAKLEKLRNGGWVEKRREEKPEEGRVLIELHHPEKELVTFRSLPLE